MEMVLLFFPFNFHVIPDSPDHNFRMAISNFLFKEKLLYILIF